MKAFLPIPRPESIRLRSSVARAMIIACALLVTMSAGRSVARDNAAGLRETSLTGKGKGPTIGLSYSKETFRKNPIASFMYFVPLISLTPVERETSSLNCQQIGVTSYEREITATSFRVTCQFEMRGNGFHVNRFEPAGMISTAVQRHNPKNGEPLKNMLDYIKFDGESAGRIEIIGTVTNSVETVTQVNLQFNANGGISPVTIGLYDVEPRDGHYGYENRSNESVARVNTLKFEKAGTLPRMAINLSSVSRKGSSEGFMSSVKGALANLFIKPVRIDYIGNATMLDFGFAMFRQEPQFTFPIAKHLKQDRTVAAY